MTSNCEALMTELLALCGKHNFEDERELAGERIKQALMQADNPNCICDVLQAAVKAEQDYLDSIKKITAATGMSLNELKAATLSLTGGFKDLKRLPDLIQILYGGSNNEIPAQNNRKERRKRGIE